MAKHSRFVFPYIYSIVNIYNWHTIIIHKLYMKCFYYWNCG